MDEFLRFLEAQGRAKETLRKYALGVEQFGNWLRSKGWNLKTAPAAALRDFVTYLALERKLSRAAVKLYIAGVRRYLDYLKGRPEGAGVVDFLPAKTAPSPHRIPTVLQGDQLSRFWTLCGRIQQPYRECLALLPLCGLRVSEITSLRIGDVERTVRGPDGQPRLVLRLIGKGNKERRVPVFNSGTKLLCNYLDGWRARYKQDLVVAPGMKQPFRWLFPAPASQKNQHVSRAAIESLVVKMRPLLQMPTLRPHTMRAVYLTALLNIGVPMHEAARYAGHSNIQTLFDHYAGLHIENAEAIFGDVHRISR